MNTYHINKGIGRVVEFKGLKAQYLFIFAGGLLAVLILVIIMYITDINPYVCLIFGSGSSGILIWQTFSLNSKYGEHGLMKIRGQRKHPRYIISRKCIFRYLRKNNQKEIS
ncbi:MULTISPECIES: DUF4133 domain-containing protein [Chryseobacterium]|jgi:hypothetical protein|uniref:DUF4133 domain-containing protein n=1 Tax=Chryseobacterium TaxID=59732 RepID=UPI001AE23B6D|nr:MULTISPECIES: DUF4133 domain-containing protein [Chryseobacterium]MBP1164554.1 hypothetical protein [Chryseobacterium sp. PvR013]MDR6461635.1 hypothetical protein [Chryseobacterium sediminis]